MHHYPIRPNRKRILLDGRWEGAFLGNVNIVEFTPLSVECTDITAVPGCYDTAGENIGKRGVAVYQTSFVFDKGETNLIIGGLGLYAKIYIDNTMIKEVKTPYSSVEIAFQSSGFSQTLTIVLDNRFNNHQTPLFKSYYDFYGFGGIYRSVYLESVPKFSFDRAIISVLDIKTGTISVKLSVCGEQPANLTVFCSFDDKEKTSFNLQLVKGIYEFTAIVPEFKIWEPSSPHLHLLRIEAEGDTIIERFGLRTVETCAQKILLNGREIYLRGVNRHESHPEFGPVQPTHLMVDDIKWIKELGANFVRGAHYQQNQAFLELCDETGILVWNESLAWGFTDHDSSNEKTAALIEEATSIMARTCANNPAVIFCGFLNECNADTQSGRQLHKSLAQTVRENNPNCLVSYAGNKFSNDICTDLVDVISINPYPGWVSGVENPDRHYLPIIKEWMDQIITDYEKPENIDKPLLVSEIGACGIWSLRDRARAQWSEEFQADYFSEAIHAIISNQRFCGITLWQLFDCRSFVNSGQIRTKPRGYNCAGLLDEYRRPKLAFDAVKNIFKDAKQPN